MASSSRRLRALLVQACHCLEKRSALPQSSAPVTAVLAARDSAQTIARALACLAALSPPPEMVVLVDDGSTDGTSALLTEYADSHLNTTVVRHPSSLGIAVSRNEALRLAKTEFVWFCDADDEWEPHILGSLLEGADDNVDVIVARALRTTPDGRSREIDGQSQFCQLTARDAVEDALTGRLHGYLWNKLVRCSLLRTDPFPILRKQSDFGGLITALSRANRVAYVPHLVYFYRQQQTSISMSSGPDEKSLATCVELAMDAADRVGIATDDPVRRMFACWFAALPIAKAQAALFQNLRKLPRASGLADHFFASDWLTLTRTSTQLWILRFFPLVFWTLLRARRLCSLGRHRRSAQLSLVRVR